MPQNFLKAFSLFNDIGTRAREKREQRRDEQATSQVLADMARMASEETESVNPETGQLNPRKSFSDYANSLIKEGADPKYVSRALGTLNTLYQQQGQDYARKFDENFLAQTMGTPILSKEEAARLNQIQSVGSGQGWNPKYAEGQAPDFAPIQYQQGSQKVTGFYNKNAPAEAEGGIAQPTTIASTNTYSEEQGAAKTSAIIAQAKKAEIEANETLQKIVNQQQTGGRGITTSKDGKVYLHGRTEDAIIANRDTALSKKTALLDKYGDDLKEAPKEIIDAINRWQEAIDIYENDLGEIRAYKRGEQWPPQQPTGQQGQSPIGQMPTGENIDTEQFFDETLPNTTDELSRRVWGSSVGSLDRKIDRMDELLDKFKIKDPEQKAAVQLSTFGEKPQFANLVEHLKRKYKLSNGRPDMEKVQNKAEEIMIDLRNGIPLTKETLNRKPSAADQFRQARGE